MILFPDPNHFPADFSTASLVSTRTSAALNKNIDWRCYGEMGHCFDCLEQKDQVRNKRSKGGPKTCSPSNVFSSSMGRTGVFVATAITNFVAGGVSLSTPALAKHLQSTFNGTTAVQAGRFGRTKFINIEKSSLISGESSSSWIQCLWKCLRKIIVGWEWSTFNVELKHFDQIST